MKTTINLAIFCFVSGVALFIGMRVTAAALDAIWPRESTVKIVHYLCIRDDESDAYCKELTDRDIDKINQEGTTM